MKSEFDAAGQNQGGAGNASGTMGIASDQAAYQSFENQLRACAQWLQNWGVQNEGNAYNAPDRGMLDHHLRFMIPDAEQRADYLNEFYKRPDVSMGTFRTIITRINAHIETTNYTDPFDRANYLHDFLRGMKSADGLRRRIYLNDADQPALKFLDIYELRDKSGCYRHGCDAHANKMAHRQLDVILEQVENAFPHQNLARKQYPATGFQAVLLARNWEFE